MRDSLVLINFYFLFFWEIRRCDPWS